MTHEQLALKVGCSAADLRKLESGAWPNLFLAFRVATALGEVAPYLQYARTFGLETRLDALERGLAAWEALKRRVAALEARHGEQR